MPTPAAQVVVGIEGGAAMTTMDMMGHGHMFEAEEQSRHSGIYLVTLTPDIRESTLYLLM